MRDGYVFFLRKLDPTLDCYNFSISRKNLQTSALRKLKWGTKKVLQFRVFYGEENDQPDQ